MCLALLGTFSCQTVTKSEIGTIHPNEAIALAKKEIVRRHLTLPSKCNVEVVRSTMVEELAGDTPIFEVAVIMPAEQRSTVLYEVSVNAISGRIEAFVNSRTLTRPQ